MFDSAPTASAVGVFSLDNTGTVVVKYVYDAWGNHKVLNPDGTENTNAGFLGNCNPYRYRGYYYCAALGLYYLKTRFYDPEIGRFISADSLDYLDPHTVGGMNLFAYCNNNPVMNVDPSGHAWWNPLDWNWQKIGEVATSVAKIAVSVAAVAVVAAASVATAGAVSVVLAGAAVGAGVGMASGAISAVASGGDLEDVANSMLSGTITGGVSGAIAAGPLGTGGQVVANAVLSTASYCAGQMSGGGDVTLGGIVASAFMGGVAGAIGQSGWMQSTAPKLFAAFSGKNALGHIVGVVGTGNLARLTFPSIFNGVLGGIHANFSKRFNPVGNFIGL